VLADAVAQVRRGVAARIQAREQHRAPGIGMHVEDFGLPRDRAQSDALGAAGGEAVHHAGFQIEAPGPVHRQHFDAETTRAWQDAQVQLANTGVLEHIARQFRGHQCHSPGIALIEAVTFGELLCRAPCMADLAAVFDQQYLGQ
jgi:hypothetical protein